MQQQLCSKDEGTNLSQFIFRVLMATQASLVFQEQRGKRVLRANLERQAHQDLMDILE